MKSRCRRDEILGRSSSDEIVRFAHDEIKSVLNSRAKHGFHHKVISSPDRAISPVRKDGFN